ncbi:hypothetical protein SAMD00019534_050080, partial [Acytostelium subglobosum LB1]|uniref:hypothetical protein n=1 Tax=Acytostelium subglobosum LB1 TaxID=1410327 RepID=UPI000644DCD8
MTTNNKIKNKSEKNDDSSTITTTSSAATNKQIFVYGYAEMNGPLAVFNTSVNIDPPLVLLLGWVGSGHKQLSKYAHYWNKKGCDTIQYATPFFDFALTTFAKFKAVRILRQIKSYLESKPRCKQIIIHMFSNGGGFNYAHMLRLMKSQKEFTFIHSYIKGVIMDSLPTLSLITGFQALQKAVPLPVFLVAVLLSPVLAVFWAPLVFNYYSTLANKTNRWQHLLIYSRADSLVDWNIVERFRRRLSVALIDHNLINYRCFDDSEHVLHMKMHAKEYKGLLDNFITAAGLQRALPSSPGGGGVRKMAIESKL